MPNDNEDVKTVEKRIMLYNNIMESIDGLEKAVSEINNTDFGYIEDYTLFKSKMNERYNKVKQELDDMKAECSFHCASEWIDIEVKEIENKNEETG